MHILCNLKGVKNVPFPIVYYPSYIIYLYLVLVAQIW